MKERKHKLFEQIKQLIEKKNHCKMVGWLRKNKVEYLSEDVEWYTIGHEADATELDIWVDGWFIQAFYDDAGNLTHYEFEEDK